MRRPVVRLWFDRLTMRRMINQIVRARRNRCQMGARNKSEHDSGGWREPPLLRQADGGDFHGDLPGMPPRAPRRSRVGVEVVDGRCRRTCSVSSAIDALRPRSSWSSARPTVKISMPLRLHVWCTADLAWFETPAAGSGPSSLAGIENAVRQDDRDLPQPGRAVGLDRRQVGIGGGRGGAGPDRAPVRRQHVPAPGRAERAGRWIHRPPDYQFVDQHSFVGGERNTSLSSATSAQSPLDYSSSGRRDRPRAACGAGWAARAVQGLACGRRRGR